MLGRGVDLLLHDTRVGFVAIAPQRNARLAMAGKLWRRLADGLPFALPGGHKLPPARLIMIGGPVVSGDIIGVGHDSLASNSRLAPGAGDEELREPAFYPDRKISPKLDVAWWRAALATTQRPISGTILPMRPPREARQASARICRRRPEFNWPPLTSP